MGSESERKADAPQLLKHYTIVGTNGSKVNIAAANALEAMYHWYKFADEDDNLDQIWRKDEYDRLHQVRE